MNIFENCESAIYAMLDGHGISTALSSNVKHGGGCVISIRSPYGMFGDHVVILELIVQASFNGVAMFVTKCLEVYTNACPHEGQTSNQS